METVLRVKKPQSLHPQKLPSPTEITAPETHHITLHQGVKHLHNERLALINGT